MYGVWISLLREQNFICGFSHMSYNIQCDVITFFDFFILRVLLMLPHYRLCLTHKLHLDNDFGSKQVYYKTQHAMCVTSVIITTTVYFQCKVCALILTSPSLK